MNFQEVKSILTGLMNFQEVELILTGLLMNFEYLRTNLGLI